VPDLAVRFWAKVDRRGEDDCWPWLAAKSAGYGRIGNPLGRGHSPLFAHRVSYELAFGPIPEGQYVCHHCDNPSCVNPAHLFLGTQADNLQDAKRKGRMRGPRVTRDANSHTKLTTADVEYIRALRAGAIREGVRLRPGSGVSIDSLAKRFGVNRSTIANVLR
jgi:hypothetical protein